MSDRKFWVFEDDPTNQVLFGEFVEIAGGIVSDFSSTMEHATSLIEDAELEAVNFAIVDGNLRSGDISGEDGNEISRLLREKFGGNIAIIGASGSNEVVGADINVGKPVDLGAFIEFVKVR